MPIDVLCVGHAAYDISLFVEQYPQEDSKYEAEALLEDCGGPSSNAAYLLSKWNVTCAFAGLVGDDLYGQRIADAFRSVGTDISMLQFRPGHVTPLSVILVNKRNGSRTIINRTRKDATFQVDFRDWGDRPPRVLLFDGHALEASLSALDAFPDAVSILDAGSWREGTAILAGKVDYVAASERFALQATGLQDFHTSEHRHHGLSDLRDRFAYSVTNAVAPPSSLVAAASMVPPMTRMTVGCFVPMRYQACFYGLTADPIELNVSKSNRSNRCNPFIESRRNWFDAHFGWTACTDHPSLPWAWPAPE